MRWPSLTLQKYLTFTCVASFRTWKKLCFDNLYFQLRRHFIQATKSRNFKNLNLRRKTDRKFRGNLLKNHFRHPKLYSNPPSWLARNYFHMGTFWKTKGWISHFWESRTLRYCYTGVHCQRILESTKTGISS